jgi:hypothetical protein
MFQSLEKGYRSDGGEPSDRVQSFNVYEVHEFTSFNANLILAPR